MTGGQKEAPSGSWNRAASPDAQPNNWFQQQNNKSNGSESGCNSANGQGAF